MKKRSRDSIYVLFVPLFCLAFASQPAFGTDSPGAIKPGDVVFTANFEGADALKPWSGQPRLAAGYQGGQSLFVERPVNTTGGSAAVQARLPLTVKPRPVAGPLYKGHDLPRLRGAMVSPNIDEEGLRVFGREWKANLIRWQIIRRRFKEDGLDLAAYQRWLDGELKRLDEVLPLCEKYGLYVVVDLHSPPGGAPTSGGYAGSDHGLFTSAACQRKFVEVWQQMARRYRGARAVWGYDLANEPVEGAVEEDLIDFQKNYNVHIYVGEFSAIRWAPDNSACRYLKDLIDIFEAHQWDWTYHAFREWQGWSVEHGPDPKATHPVDTPTDRQRLLREWFVRNEKPRW